ncbi:hypothetical protein QCA50_013458 [Cerrena zonata]|uniref:Uncharacterized protein n=1 Tax=Cerrena zonata TaxID=2478898 RepID=A0AAW0G3I9_9APHY
MVAPQPFLKFIDDNKGPFISRLAEAVAIQSVSADASKRKDVIAMASWLEGQLKQYGVTTQQVPLGTQELDGQTIDLPPAILGRIGNDPKKKTVLVYGHFDVQPASKGDGWNTEPFELYVDEKSKKLYGRGSTDDKGPILGWLNVLEAHHTLNTPLPVNMVFCFEGMEESGSEGLDDLIASEAKKGKMAGSAMSIVSAFLTTTGSTLVLLA